MFLLPPYAIVIGTVFSFFYNCVILFLLQHATKKLQPVRVVVTMAGWRQRRAFFAGTVTFFLLQSADFFPATSNQRGSTVFLRARCQRCCGRWPWPPEPWPPRLELRPWGKATACVEPVRNTVDDDGELRRPAATGGEGDDRQRGQQ